jgi:hypothetical protein
MHSEPFDLALYTLWILWSGVIPTVKKGRYITCFSFFSRIDPIDYTKLCSSDLLFDQPRQYVRAVMLTEQYPFLSVRKNITTLFNTAWRDLLTNEILRRSSL